MSGFPLGDWQFWVVTAAVAVPLGLVLGRFVRGVRRRRRGLPRPVRTTLTIGGTPIGR